MYRKSPSKIWRKRKSKYRLEGNKFGSDQYYPPVNVVPGTLNTNLKPVTMPQKAKLVTWSEVKVAPEGFEGQTPYAVGILEFDNGERLTGQIVDVDFTSLQKGDVLYPTFRKIFEDGDDGVIQYGLKWSR